MWVELISLFLGLSLLLYALLGGADFGAGILELFLGRQKREAQKNLISHAMGPVWEANHMWLIVAVTILFNGFPKAFSTLSILFHLPLSLMLVGILLRGSAFTFRSYDVIRDEAQKYYSFIFISSSFLAPFFLGAVAGGILLAKTPSVQPGALPSYYDFYVASWLNCFSIATGIFLCCLFAFLASVYLIGEAKVAPPESPEFGLKDLFIRRAQACNIAIVVAGILVFVGAEISGLNLIERFFHDLGSLMCMALATTLFYPLWQSLYREKVKASRIYAAAQVTCVLLGWFKLQFPVILIEPYSHRALTIYNAAAPESTLRYLLYALVGGSCLIFPALFYLFQIYKFKPQPGLSGTVSH